MIIVPDLSSSESQLNSTVTKEPVYDRTNIILGCILAIVGNLTISISLNVQKYVHLRNTQLEQPTSYWKIPLWWLGICLMILGESGNFVALGLAPASLIAPLGTTTVIANMLIVVIFLKEKLRPEDIFGTTLALIGAFMTVTFSSENHPNLTSHNLSHLLSRIPFLVYISVEAIILVILLVLYHRFGYDQLVVLLGICEIYASVTIITAKGVSSLLSLSLKGQDPFKDFVIYVFFILLVVTGVLQVIYLNKAMQLYNSAVVVPSHFVLFTITAIIAGVMYYQEFSHHNSLQIFMFLFGCILSCIGVYFIQQDKGAYTGPRKLSSSENSIDDPIKEKQKKESLQLGSETNNSDWVKNQTVSTHQQIPNKTN